MRFQMQKVFVEMSGCGLYVRICIHEGLKVDASIKFYINKRRVNGRMDHLFGVFKKQVWICIYSIRLMRGRIIINYSAVHRIEDNAWQIYDPHRQTSYREGFDEINLFRFLKMYLHFTCNVAMWSRAWGIMAFFLSFSFHLHRIIKYAVMTNSLDLSRFI